MRQYLLNGTVHHVDEEEGDGFVVDVFDLPVVLVNVVSDPSPGDEEKAHTVSDPGPDPSQDCEHGTDEEKAHAY